MSDARDVLTWDKVKVLLADRPRGAAFQLAKRLGMNSSFLYRRLNNSRAVLDERQGQVVRAFLADLPEPGQGEEPRTGETVDERRLLDVYGYAAAGEDELVVLAEGQVIDRLALPLGLELGPGEWFVVRPTGSSMEPRIFAGEDLVVRRGLPPKRGKEVVVEFTDGNGVIKTYQGQRDGKVWCEQYSPPKVLGYDAASVRRLHAVAFKL